MLEEKSGVEVAVAPSQGGAQKVTSPTKLASGDSYEIGGRLSRVKVPRSRQAVTMPSTIRCAHCSNILPAPVFTPSMHVHSGAADGVAHAAAARGDVLPHRPLSPLEPTEDATVGVKALRAVFTMAAMAKLDVARLAGQHGIRPADLDDHTFRLPHETWIALWDEVERRSEDPGIGLRAASELPLGHWDVVDYLIASSETVGQALERVVLFFPLISTGLHHLVTITTDEVRVIREHQPGLTGSRSASEFVVASILLRLRQLASSPWRPKYVAFSHPPSVEQEEYERLFDCRVSFRQQTNVFVVDRSVLDVRMVRPEAELGAVLERYAISLLASVPRTRPGVVARAKGAIMSHLTSGSPSISATAKRLGMSPRTLQRRLTEAGVAYSDLVEHTREALARRHLADMSIEINEVASLVGFADVSAFYKAFRRWTGLTPGAYREGHRSDIRHRASK